MYLERILPQRSSAACAAEENDEFSYYSSSSNSNSICSSENDDLLNRPHLHQQHFHSRSPLTRSRSRRRWLTTSFRWPSFPLLFLLYLCSIAVVNGAKAPPGSRNSGVDRECNGIANVIRNKGFTYPWWETSSAAGLGIITSSTNSSSISGDDSSTGSSGCSLGTTGQKGVKCCKALDTTMMKNEVAGMFNDKWMGPKLQTSAELFKERKKKFDVTFKDLLTRAHGSFHAMFERT